MNAAENEQSQEALFEQFPGFQKRQKRLRIILLSTVGVVIAGVLLCALWLNVPRRVDLTLDALVFASEENAAGTTTVRIKGGWTPNWFGDAKATFEGEVTADGVEWLDSDRFILDRDLEFLHCFDQTHVASAFILREATTLTPSDVDAVFSLYWSEAQNAIVITLSKFGTNDDDITIVCGTDDPAQAYEILSAVLEVN